MKARYLLTAVVVIAALSGVVDATDAPYNTTGTGGEADWLAGLEDANLDDIAALVARIPAFILLGSGGGEVITGVLVAGAVIGAVGVNRAGFIAGGLTGTVVTMAIVATGTAPAWLDAAVMMLVGLLLAVVFMRIR